MLESILFMGAGLLVIHIQAHSKVFAQSASKGMLRSLQARYLSLPNLMKLLFRLLFIKTNVSLAEFEFL